MSNKIIQIISMETFGGAEVIIINLLGAFFDFRKQFSRIFKIDKPAADDIGFFRKSPVFRGKDDRNHSVVRKNFSFLDDGVIDVKAIGIDIDAPGLDGVM